MGMKITKNGSDLTVETDYGSGFVDQENAKWDREILKNYMSETKRDCLQGSDYSDIKNQIRREKEEKKKEEKRRYVEWAREHSYRR